MSFEGIISEIKNKPEIWFSSHRLFKNRAVKAKAWRVLAAKLEIKEVTLKKRWKHLKDHYRKELKKRPVLKSGADSDNWESPWQYYDLMTFMKDEMMPSPSIGKLNVNHIQKTESTDTQNEIDFLDIEAIVSAASQPPQPSPVSFTPPRLSSSSGKRTNISEDMLEIEKKKLKLVEKRLTESQNNEILNSDEDYLFLKSILPSMKKLTHLQKLHFRGKINDWLIEATTQNELNFH